jgi:hypothetical protein
LIDQPAVCRVSGPAHVVRAATPAMRAICDRPMVGIPLREAFPEPGFVGLFALVDWARQYRAEVRVAVPPTLTADAGVITLTPEEDDAIVISWRRVPRRALVARSELPLVRVTAAA